MKLRLKDTENKPMSMGLARIKHGTIWYILSTCLFFSLPTWAQESGKWSKIDRQARSIRFTGQSLTELADQITQHSTSPKEKARALFTWTATHLYYDRFASSVEAKWDERQPMAILNRGKGVCWDYATVFQALCQRASIPCLRVTGYSRADMKSNQLPEKPDHAWNIIQIDDSWFAVDVTWQSGAPKGNDVFQQLTGADYFCTPPELFIVSHIPEHPMFQLLSCPAPAEFFQDLREVHHPTPEPPCPEVYHYADSIRYYQSLLPEDRSLWFQEGVYRFFPNPANRRYLNQAIVDRGIAFQADGDGLYGQNQFEGAAEYYDRALQLFSRIPDQDALFDWQQKAIGITWFNRGMTCRQMSGPDCQNHFKEAWQLLQQYEGDALLSPVLTYLRQLFP